MKEQKRRSKNKKKQKGKPLSKALRSTKSFRKFLIQYHIVTPPRFASCDG